MRLIPASVACLLLPLVLTVLPITMTGCGGDRYSCDDCNDSGGTDPDESGAEDPKDILPLSFVEAADFSILKPNDVSAVEDFDNFYNINFRVNTITEASATEYDDKTPLANIAGISAERWDDSVAKLTWSTATSDLDDGKQRAYYLLTDNNWKLNTTTNRHDLRRYKDNVYDFWLDNNITIKWEIFEAHDRVNSNGEQYPSIAGKNIDELHNPLFLPPVLSNSIALDSVYLWGKDKNFSDTTNAEAKIVVVYKQFRPITLEGDTNAAVQTANFVAFVPAPANEGATAFGFHPLSSTTIPELFIAERAGEDTAARFPIMEGKLYASFVINGVAGTGGNGVMLWSSRQTDTPDGTADFDITTVNNGSYIVIRMTPQQKIFYGLETYENPLVALIEDDENGGANNGPHVGWYYVPSGTLDVDKPLPHYAFNGAAVSDIKTDFSAWRHEKYCDDNDHDQDPGFASICSGTTTTTTTTTN